MDDPAPPGGTTHSLVKAVQAVPSFASISESTLLMLVGDSANLFWPAGSQVLARGSQPDGLYVVLSGTVRVLDGAGGELNVLGAGDFFGEFSLLLGTPHQNDVEAATDVELMVVPKDRVETLLHSDPELGARIRRTLEERLEANARLSSAGN